MLCKSFFDTYKRPERFLVLLNLMGSQMITPRNFSCSRAKQQYGTGKRQLMMRWKWYCLRCFLIWCLGSKECSYSLENTPSNDIPYTTIQILNICVQGVTSYAKARRAFAKKFAHRRKFEALTYTICRDIKICRNLRTLRKSSGKKSA